MSDGHNYCLLQRGNGYYEDSEDSQSSQETDSSQSSRETDSSQEVREHLNPWSRILDEPQERHEVQFDALHWSTSTKGTEIRKMYLTLKRRTLSLLSTEKN